MLPPAYVPAVAAGHVGMTREVYPWVPLEGRSPGGENEERRAVTSDWKVCRGLRSVDAELEECWELNRLGCRRTVGSVCGRGSNGKGFLAFLTSNVDRGSQRRILDFRFFNTRCNTQSSV